MSIRDIITGTQDSRSKRAILSRGKNVYKGTSSKAHSGGGKQFGRPKKDLSGSVERRLNKSGFKNTNMYPIRRRST